MSESRIKMRYEMAFCSRSSESKLSLCDHTAIVAGRPATMTSESKKQRYATLHRKTRLRGVANSCLEFIYMNARDE